MYKLPEFKNKKLLELALTHRSSLNERDRSEKDNQSNERLEFLGDTILSFVTSIYLYKTYPNFKEGQLTNLRSILVKTVTLATIAQKLELGKMLKISHGEELSGGRNNQSILADVFEAYVGALYLDRGIKIVDEFISENLFTLIPSVLKNGSLKDYKSLLQEFVQEKFKDSPIYKVEKEIGPDHFKTFQIAVCVKEKEVGNGKGKSKQNAEQEAAKNALEYYQSNTL